MDDSPIHTWFELTYASYLVLPRSLLQEMPLEWQQRFVACLEEMRETFDAPGHGYCVTMRDEKNRFVKDPLSNYRRPDREYIKSIRKKVGEP